MNVLTAERVLVRRKTFVDADSKTRSALSSKGELSTPSPALRNPLGLRGAGECWNAFLQHSPAPLNPLFKKPGTARSLL